jgi:hypothetical protein
VYEKSLNEAELILSVQKDAILPVRRIWEEVVKVSKIKGFEVASLADFSAMLDGDNRFQIIPAHKEKSDEDDLLSGEIELDDPEMESLGFYSEDQVRLKPAKNVEQLISEDEEEVGSIKRKAFLSQKIKKIKLPLKTAVKKKADSKYKHKSKPIKKKKTKSRVKGKK